MKSCLRVAVLLLAAGLPLACGAADAPLPALRLVYEPAILPQVDPTRFPFPDETYRGSGGLELAPGPQARFFETNMLLPALAELDGFGNQQPVFFGLQGRDGGLPAALAVERAALAGVAGLVSADPADPDFGRAWPAEVNLDPRRGLIGVLPRPGFPLRPGGLYAAWVSGQLGDVLGAGIEASPAWRRVATGRPAGAAERRAAAALDAVRPALAAAGLDVSGLLAVASMRVQDPSADLRAMVTQLKAEAAPPAPVFDAPTYADDVSAALPLAVLFGTPVAAFGGSDNPGGVLHDRIAAVHIGRFEIPVWSDFRARTPLARDAAGQPRIVGRSEVEFVLAVPDCPEPAAGWPAVIVQHGLNDHKRFPLIQANALAGECMVTVGIDAVGHGFRSRNPQDRRGNLTNAPWPDGITDGAPLGGLDQVYAIQPLVARTNLIETAAGLAALADRLARATWQPPAVTGLPPVRIDPSRIGYLGQSMGGVVGSLFTGVSPDLRASVINVGGGSYRHIFLDAPAFAMASPLVAVMGEGDLLAPIDEFHPGLALFAAVLEGADPANYSRLWALAPPPGSPARHVLMQIAEFDQLIAHTASAILAHAAGAALLGEQRPRGPLYVDAEPLPLPRAGVPPGPAAATGRAVALTVFPQAEHGFIQTRCHDIRFTVERPFEVISPPIPNANPTLESQVQAARFLRTAFEGAPEILPSPAGDPAAPGC